MGYFPRSYQIIVQPWLDAGWLKPGHRLMEFGAQEFYSEVEETRREVGAFLRGRGLPESVLGDGLPQVRAIYEAMGIDYTSIDVDGTHGSIYFDLNTFATPAKWHNAFDFVSNEGTIEHLINPINAFHVAHEMGKVGGVIRHSFPLIGWRDHGFLYSTTKFYAHLVGDNGYELLRAAAVTTGRTPFDDPFFKEMIDQDSKPVAPPEVTDIWGELVYRKTSDQPFVIPIDHLSGPNAGAVRHRLIENYRQVAQARISTT
jgi:hypothetical protein